MSGDSVRDVPWCICCQTHHKEKSYASNEVTADQQRRAACALLYEIMVACQCDGCSHCKRTIAILTRKESMQENDEVDGLEDRMAGRTLDEYVHQTICEWIHGNPEKRHYWYVGSIPPLLDGMVAMTAFWSKEDAQEFADSLNGQAWVVSPEGELV